MADIPAIFDRPVKAEDYFTGEMPGPRTSDFTDEKVDEMTLRLAAGMTQTLKASMDSHSGAQHEIPAYQNVETAELGKNSKGDSIIHLRRPDGEGIYGNEKRNPVGVAAVEMTSFIATTDKAFLVKGKWEEYTGREDAEKREFDVDGKTVMFYGFPCATKFVQGDLEKCKTSIGVKGIAGSRNFGKDINRASFEYNLLRSKKKELEVEMAEDLDPSDYLNISGYIFSTVFQSGSSFNKKGELKDKKLPSACEVLRPRVDHYNQMMFSLQPSSRFDPRSQKKIDAGIGGPYYDTVDAKNTVTEYTSDTNLLLYKAGIQLCDIQGRPIHPATLEQNIRPGAVILLPFEITKFFGASKKKLGPPLRFIGTPVLLFNGEGDWGMTAQPKDYTQETGVVSYNLMSIELPKEENKKTAPEPLQGPPTKQAKLTNALLDSDDEE